MPATTCAPALVTETSARPGVEAFCLSTAKAAAALTAGSVLGADRYAPAAGVGAAAGARISDWLNGESIGFRCRSSIRTSSALTFNQYATSCGLSGFNW